MHQYQFKKLLSKKSEEYFFRRYYKAIIIVYRLFNKRFYTAPVSKIIIYDAKTNYLYKKLKFFKAFSKHIPLLQKCIQMIEQTYDVFTVNNRRLVISIAKKYNIRNQINVLVHEGTVALVRSISKFNTFKGYKFSTFGTLAIKQAIVKVLNENWRVIRVPLHMVQRMWKASQSIPFTNQTPICSMVKSPDQEKDEDNNLNKKVIFQKIINKLSSQRKIPNPITEFVMRLIYYKIDKKIIIKEVKNKFTRIMKQSPAKTVEGCIKEGIEIIRMNNIKIN